MGGLLYLDIKSIIGLLVWSNLGLSILLLAYRRSRSEYDEQITVTLVAGAKIAQCFGWGLLFYRTELPYILTMYMGNILLFIGFFLETMVMLVVSGHMNQTNRRIQVAVVLIGSLIFLSINSAVSPSVFVIVASLVAASIFIYPTLLYLSRKTISIYKNLISVFNVVLIVALFLRAYGAYIGVNNHLFALNNIQNVTFITLVILTVTSAPSYLFQLKEKADQELMELATLDSLTRVMNRRAFLKKIEKEIEYHKEHQQYMAVLFIDIDHFKSVNDTYGHEFGDEVLISLARVLKETVRGSDYVSRYGGEEFVVVLKDTTLEGAEVVYEHIREQIKQLEFPVENFYYTISVGICCKIPSKASIHEFISKADHAMYQAKNQGRNRCIISKELNE